MNDGKYDVTQLPKKRKHKICPLRSSLGGELNCKKEDCAWWIKAEYEEGAKVEGCCVPIGIDVVDRMLAFIEDGHNETGGSGDGETGRQEEPEEEEDEKREQEEWDEQEKFDETTEEYKEEMRRLRNEDDEQ